MKKTEFFQQYGGGLIAVDHDNPQYGDYLILYPEEIDRANQLLEEGYDIYTVYEESAENEEETVVLGMDSGAMVVGYYAVKP